MLGVYSIVHGRRSLVLSLAIGCLELFDVVVIGSMNSQLVSGYATMRLPTYLEPIEDVCLVREPNYGGCLRLAGVDPRERIYYFSPELQITSYRAIFDRYGLYPAEVQELAFSGRLHLTPPYRP